jgi:hypothetical protein
MMRVLKIIFTALIVAVRLYLVFKLFYYLKVSFNNPEISLNEAQWYVYALLLDLYIVKILDNSNSDDIYSKKE